VIKRVLLAALLAVPLCAGVLPQAHASTPKAATSVNTTGPMFCVWSRQVDMSYCQYTFPRLP
jgi:hypothetical protein